MKNLRGFGEKVDGFDVPVLNEREIRASAGILFLFALISFFVIVHTLNFAPIKYFILVFVLDFIIRVFINPVYSPTLIIGRLIVMKQAPEYTGAPQKKFAWTLGLVLGLIMLILMPVLNTYSVITGIICFICLIFLFFESAFGICLGCLIYNRLNPEKAKYCPGGICEPGKREEIQRVRLPHLLIVAGLFLYLMLAIFLLNDSFREKPQDLWVKMGWKTETTVPSPE